ncbi:MAG: CotH kinase family protein, partial [Lachnospiraceae bacterium]|nr:CotH kinase family protein [Lachnospiraceae bacterium]
NVEDPAYIRNKITYEMAIAAGMEGSPKSQYIDLYINHTYHGMYQLCEKVEIDAERVPVADLEAENERLNRDIEKCGHFETEERKGMVLLTEPGDLTGGYLLERDVPEKYWEEVSGFATDGLGDLYTIKEPTYASEAEVDYISGLVNDMERAILSEDGVNPDTGMSYTDYIDMRSFAQKYILEELSKNNGAGATSSFFYKPQDTISTKLFAGPVWDYDKAYASLTGMNESVKDLCYLMLRDSNPTYLFLQLNRHPEFLEEVSVCYREFFSDYMQEIVDEKIDEYVSEISVSVAMDRIRWKSVDDEPVDYDYEIEKIKKFLLARKKFLDEAWLEQEELCMVTFVSETDREYYVSVIVGSTLERLPGSEPGTVSGDMMFDGWYTERGVPFDDTTPVSEDITVYGKSHILSGTE